MNKHLKSIISIVLPAVVIAMIINSFILINVVVPTVSMKPLIEADDRLFASRLSYVFGEPERGDVVVFNSNYEDKLLVKRIIGLPGETIMISEGLIYVDGDPIEDYTKITTNGEFGPYEVPEGEYFMMGDNRNKSHDSRMWDDPFIEKDEILGKIFFKYYPRREFF